MATLSVSEKLAICQNCKNRKFNPSVGMTCGLTESKPTFEENCSNYSADEAALVRQTELNKRLDEKEKREKFEQCLLAGFLGVIWGSIWSGSIWIGVIVGLFGLLVCSSYIGAICIGIICCTLGWFTEGMHYYVGIAVSVVYLPLFLLIGIMAIVSYKKQKDNAVPLGTTFWIMMVIVAVFQVVSELLLTGHLYALGYVIVNLFCSSEMVWHIYFSRDTKEKFPKASRKWHILEKVVLTITVVLFTITLILGPDKILDRRIEQANSQLPVALSDVMDYCSLERIGNDVIFLYRLKNVHIDDVPETAIEEHSLMAKERLVYMLNSTRDKFTDYASKSHNLVFKYLDANGKEAYSISISPKEYTMACADDFKYHTEPKVLERILDLESNMIPEEVIPGMRFNFISFANNQIVFNFTVVGMISTEIQDITQDSLKQFLEDNLSQLYGDVLELAAMNQLPITFDFTSEMLEWWGQSVTFAPDEYESILSSNMES